jgi:hypothetical protein
LATPQIPFTLITTKGDKKMGLIRDLVFGVSPEEKEQQRINKAMRDGFDAP